MFFADLLKKYLDEVNPEAKVLFMSFIEQNGNLHHAPSSTPGQLRSPSTVPLI